MTRQTSSISAPHPAQRLNRRRRAAEHRFRLLCITAVGFLGLVLVFLIGSVALRGLSTLTHHTVSLTISLPDQTPHTLSREDIRNRLSESVKHDPIAVSLISGSEAVRLIRQCSPDTPSCSVNIPVTASADRYLKGRANTNGSESTRRLTRAQTQQLDMWKTQKTVRRHLYGRFFTNPDSLNSERAGIGGALRGSLMIILSALLFSVPIGFGAGIWLQELATPGRLKDILDNAVNNAVAIPSVLYGLAGVVIFLNFFHLPRALPIIAGAILALRAVPIITAAVKAALQSVPPGPAEGALSLGASPMQAVFHHKIPVAAPSLITGLLLATAQILGETAPLLLIGTAAFMTHMPDAFTQPAGALPTQIFMWTESPQSDRIDLAAAGALVLMTILVALNFTAVIIRRVLAKRRGH